MVVSRAIIRDLFRPDQAQKVMSQVTIYFGVAPAIAPIIGGFLFVHAGWHAIFWFLVGVGVVLGLTMWRMLPESLHESQVRRGTGGRRRVAHARPERRDVESAERTFHRVSHGDHLPRMALLRVEK